MPVGRAAAGASWARGAAAASVNAWTAGAGERRLDRATPASATV